MQDIIDIRSAAPAEIDGRIAELGNEIAELEREYDRKGWVDPNPPRIHDNPWEDPRFADPNADTPPF